jgi:hypothetical protein
MTTETFGEACGPTPRQLLVGRLRQLRVDRYGEEGGPMLADLVGVPARTWLNYEHAVAIPGEVLLVLIVLTGVEPLWLHAGVGPMYRGQERPHITSHPDSLHVAD